MIIFILLFVIMFIKLYFKIKVKSTGNIERHFLNFKNKEDIVKTVKTSDTNNHIGDDSKNVFSPPEELVMGENSLELFPVNQSISVVTEDQFKQLMKSRTSRLQEVCNRTLEFKRKFNFRSIYVLQVNKRNISNH